MWIYMLDSLAFHLQRVTETRERPNEMHVIYEECGITDAKLAVTRSK